MGNKRFLELNRGLGGQEKQWHEVAALYMLNEKQAGGEGEHQEPAAKSNGRCAHKETCSQGKSLRSRSTQCITRNDSQPGKQTGFANTPHHRENRTRAARQRCLDVGAGGTSLEEEIHTHLRQIWARFCIRC